MPRAHGAPQARRNFGCFMPSNPKSLKKSGAARAKDKLLGHQNREFSPAIARNEDHAKMTHSISDLLSRDRL